MGFVPVLFFVFCFFFQFFENFCQICVLFVCVFFELGAFIKLSCVCLSSFLLCVFVGGVGEFSNFFFALVGKKFYLGFSYQLKDT